MMRASKRLGQKMMKQPENAFEEMAPSEIQARLAGRYQRLPDRVWINNHYVVQLYRAERELFGQLCDKLMIRRNDAEPISGFYTLQKIKNKIAGDDALAVQVFPPESELVDVANMYWLFLKAGEL